MTPSKKKEGNTHDRILKRCLNSNRLKKGRKYKIETKEREKETNTTKTTENTHVHTYEQTVTRDRRTNKFNS